jgi:23S rRNA (uracil1939-C5)-methyltransferase
MKERTILKRGDKKEVTIESIAPGGEGVSKDFGLPIFIEKAAVGDGLAIEISDAKSNFARGRILEILRPSSDRAEPPCPLFDRCGGCQWQHLSYPAQLKAKADIIRQSFRHIANLPTDVMRPVIESPKQLFYRNKVQFLASPARGGEGLQLGYYEAGSHNLIDITHCPVQSSSFDAVMNLVRTLCHKFGVSAYDVRSRKGLLRSVSVRHSESSGEILVTLVLNCPRRSMPTKFMPLAKEILEMPEVAGVCANFHVGPDGRLYGDETICLAGKPHITEVLKTEQPDYPERLRKGLLFQLSATSFFQVNSQQAIKMLESIHKIVEEFLEQKSAPQQEVTLLDAYAGVGAIALWLAPFVDHVIAIEENPEAIADARINLELNEIKNVDFYGGRVEDALPELINERIVPDIVVIDPPRKGCTREVLDGIIELAPQLIIYISCNPVTLARDLRFILGGNHKFTGEVQNNAVFGYKTKQIIPIDFFPQTYHIESITVLERQLINDEDGDVEAARAR